MQKDIVVADGGTLITNVTIIPGANLASIDLGYIAIQEDKIVALGSMCDDLTRFSSYQKQEMEGYIVCPGFVNSHSHASMSFFRGLGHDRILPKREGYSIIEDFFFPAERALTSEMIEPLSYSYLIDGLKAGVTCLNDAYFFSEGVCRAISRLGIKGAVGEHMADLDGAVVTDENDWKDYVRRIENWEYSQIQPVVYAHAADTVSKSFLQRMSDFAKSNNLPFHMHLSQTQGERERVLAREGISPVKYAHECGALHSRSMLVHLLSVDEEDIKLIADSGAVAGLCPVSEILYESAPPASDLIRAGIPIALGTDCAASSDGADVLQEARFFALLLRTQGIQFPQQTPSLIIDSITKNPTEWMTGKTGGVVAEGSAADLVFLKKDICTEPLSDLAVNLLYSSSSRNVDHVMVNGHWVLKNKQLANVSEAVLRDEYHRALRDLKEKTGLPIVI